MVKEYRLMTEQCFTGIDSHDGERQRVFGMFGDEDPLVDTRDIFLGHYPQAISFHGEHRMNDRSFMHSVMPVVRWIDDRQEHRERPIIYIGIETLRDSYLKPTSSCQKAVRLLLERYQLFFVAPSTPAPRPLAEYVEWLEQYINVPAWNHTVLTNHRQLLLGDYLVEAEHTADPMATRLEYGSDTFKTWEDLIDYFELLGGQ